MEAYALEWLNLLLRWLHLIVGIAWIGASFYFVWLDNHIEAPKHQSDVDRGIGGELWAVHGGGFYHAEKFRARPPAIPERLHWFKWEAYWTWISGFALLIIIYYVGADIHLIDRAVADISRGAAIAIGLGFIAGGWIVYDLLCRSPLARSERTVSLIMFVSLCIAAWGLTQVFGGRGAYIHFGAMLGTIMVANVAMVIMPSQRAMVRAAEEGRDPDPRYGIAGKQRSVHNTYFTLPVLFVMMSSHYAFTFGHRYNWGLLIAMSLAGALIRVWFVDRHKGKQSPLTLVAAAGLLAIVAWAGLPVASKTAASAPGDFQRVRAVVAERCSGCHAAHPTFAGISAPPKGVMLETEAQIRDQAALIVQQSSTTRVMPPGNLTGMTDDERALIAAWASGAKSR
ncbi:MAG: urate hydroxylase PuuD [Burkholderiales bacterium]